MCSVIIKHHCFVNFKLMEKPELQEWAANVDFYGNKLTMELLLMKEGTIFMGTEKE